MTNPDDIVAAEPPDEPVNVREPFWQWPSRTWLAAILTPLAGIAGNAIDTGWDKTETKALVLWAFAGVLAYLVPDKK